MANQMVCLDDFEKHASETIEKSLYDYVSGGACHEMTLEDNRQAFKRYRLMPRVLRDVSSVDMSTTILGHKVAFPLGLSPTAGQKMVHQDGEIAMARAAQTVGIPYTLSVASASSMQDVSHGAPDGVKFFQLFIPKDRTSLIGIIKAAEMNGYKALVVSVDQLPIGIRYWNMRNQSKAPANVKSDMLYTATGKTADDLHGKLSVLENQSSATWDDISWLKSVTNLPVVVKGILSANDADLAAGLGVSAVWVSNHGGRQLDTVPATIDVLESVVHAVAGRCEVYMDGGIRCGTDVLKALALGARAVFMGRPTLYGLAYNGEEGVKEVLDLLTKELHVAMSLSGCASLSAISRDLVIHESEYSSKLWGMSGKGVAATQLSIGCL